jgi:exosortase A
MTTLFSPGDNAEISSRRIWPVAGTILALGIVSFCVGFHTELVRAVQVWNESTAYNHCFLILPISLYLIWERRYALLARAPGPAGWPLLLMIPAGLVWLFADRAALMEGRQLAAMTLFQLFVLAVLGFKAWRVIAFALLYLYFLVPFGAFLTPAMQDFAARFAVGGLHLLKIPVYSDGFNIEVPGAKFLVAEACAGLRFLIASIALGTLYGYMMYRSWVRRAAFIVVSVVIPVLANGLRVLGIVVLGYLLGDAEAAVADHLIYGWVFFSLVSLILIMLGLPFRQPMIAFPVEHSDLAKTPRLQAARTASIWIASAAFIALLHSSLLQAGPAADAVGSVIASFKNVLSGS